MIKKHSCSYWSYVHVLFLFGLGLLLALPGYAKSIERAAVAAPRHDYQPAHVINAEQAVMLKLPDSTVQIVLKGVDTQITIRSHQPSSNNSIPLQNWLGQWRKQGHPPLRANVTGIQVDNKKVGHKQFYATIHLISPQYHPDKDELTFNAQMDVVNALPYPLEEIKTVTLFIEGAPLDQVAPSS